MHAAQTFSMHCTPVCCQVRQVLSQKRQTSTTQAVLQLHHCHAQGTLVTPFGAPRFSTFLLDDRQEHDSIAPGLRTISSICLWLFHQDNCTVYRSRGVPHSPRCMRCSNVHQQPHMKCMHTGAGTLSGVPVFRLCGDVGRGLGGGRGNPADTCPVALMPRGPHNSAALHRLLFLLCAATQQHCAGVSRALCQRAAKPVQQ